MERRAEGTHNLRVRRHKNRAAEVLGYEHADTLVQRHSTRKKDLAGRRNPLQQRNRPAHDGLVDAKGHFMALAPWAVRDMTSDSAKTVHMLLIFSARSAERAAFENSSRL